MAVALSADDRAWIQTELNTLFTNIKNDLTGTKLRVAADDPIVRDLDTRVAALQQAVASLPGGSADAKAVVDELGRRLNAGA